MKQVPTLESRRNMIDSFFLLYKLYSGNIDCSELLTQIKYKDFWMSIKNRIEIDSSVRELRYHRLFAPGVIKGNVLTNIHSIAQPRPLRLKLWNSPLAITFYTTSLCRITKGSKYQHIHLALLKFIGANDTPSPAVVPKWLHFGSLNPCNSQYLS